MLIEGSFTLKAPIQKVWDFLLEPSTLQACIPGAEKVTRLDPKTYEAIIKQKVGPISVKLKIIETITEMDAPKYVKLVGRGEDVMKAGTVTQETIVHMKEISKDEVEVAYSSNASIVGRMATFGERIMRAKVKQVGEEFTKNLQTKLKEVQNK
jgi:carbon monoxide dehydrogenase subunit G